jgi:26S proteasome regulatory subunit N11
MDRLQRMLGAGGMGAGGGAGGDAPQQDTSEQIYISSLALLKMLKHGRAGVPLEVMGLMLGEFVDEYTVKVRGRAPGGWVCGRVTGVPSGSLTKKGA